MRVTLELPPEQLEALNRLGEAKRCSFEALVREAAGNLLSKHEAGNLDEAFGLWRTGTGELEDGLTYQMRLRAEWR